MEDFSINLQSLNESVDTTNDWNSNLNSASSLPWADDELENHATLRVQQCLDELEDFLISGQQSTSKSFDLNEAEQWNKMVLQFQFQGLLQDSRQRIDEKKLVKHKKELEIEGHSSYVHSPSTKMNGATGFQTPRIRSAYPTKSATQPTRIRSAYPNVNRPSPALTSANLRDRRPGAKSGNANERFSHSLTINGVRARNADYLKILDDTARLSIVQRGRSATVGDEQKLGSSVTVSSSPSKNYTPLKRIKLQPPSLPKFVEGEAVHALPPLTEPSRQIPTTSTASRGRTKGKTNLKSAKPTTTSNGDSFPLGRSATNVTTSSAVQRSGFKAPTGTGYYRHQQMYNLPSPPILPPPPQPPIFRTGHNISDVGIVGTSLSLFEPIVRPVRPIAVPKFRTSNLI